MEEQKRKLGLFFIVLSLLLLPGMQVLFIIGCNSKYLIRAPFFISVCILIVLLTILLIVGIILFNKSKKEKNKKKIFKILFNIFMVIYLVGCVFFVVLLYGPNEKFKTWLITTAMQTKDHQYLCKWFYSDKDIYEILNNNYVEESGESTDASLIKKEYKYKKDSYENDYERQILDVEDDIK